MAGLAFVDEFAGVFDLFRRQLPLASEFHASPLRCPFTPVRVRSPIRLRSRKSGMCELL
jgi:hypothetical protein